MYQGTLYVTVSSGYNTSKTIRIAKVPVSSVVICPASNESILFGIRSSLNVTTFYTRPIN